MPALPLNRDGSEKRSTHDKCKKRNFVGAPVGGTAATKPSPMIKADVKRTAINLSERKASEKALLVQQRHLNASVKNLQHALNVVTDRPMYK